MASDKDEVSATNWPDSFKRILVIFAQINTQITFLGSHSRDTKPTFELLQKINSGITELDLAIIKYLMPPGSIKYEYVDENSLELAKTEKVKFNFRSGYSQNTPNSVYEMYDIPTDLNFDREISSKMLLIFNFTDIKVDGIGSALKRKFVPPNPRDSTFFSSHKTLKLSQLNSKQLQSIILSRLNKFKSCVNQYLKAFSEKELEGNGEIPMNNLISVCKPLIPKKASLLTGMEIINNTITGTSEYPELSSILGCIYSKPFYRNQVSEVLTLTEARSSKFLNVNSPEEPNVIHPLIKAAYFNYKNISIDEGLYSHQAKALRALLFDQTVRNHVIVSTPTSSGKSLIFQIPILNNLLHEFEASGGVPKQRSTAFFLYPTKALAQDQMRDIKELLKFIEVPYGNDIIVGTFDGDTSKEERQYNRKFADIIFTNPDTIHSSVLPSFNGNFENSGWARFIMNLKYVVIDELHILRGTFGLHVAYVMRRLLRIREKLLNIRGASTDLRFISCSATIKDPIPHFRSICCIPEDDIIVHIAEDGSPSSEKRLIVWNPPSLMNKNGVTLSQSNSNIKSFVPRENPISESAKLLIHLLSNDRNIKVIIFCPIRVICELLMKEVRLLISSSTEPATQSLMNQIMSYRGGYNREDRRIIERKMFNKELRAIVATSALELGIDISDLDVVISCGFPMSKSNLHQQFGRAGRGKFSKGSLAILVCGSSPIDQYYLKHPQELCKKTYEDLCVSSSIENCSSHVIIQQHLQCAAFEYPIDANEDKKWFLGKRESHAEIFLSFCKDLVHIDNFYRTSVNFLPWPSQFVSLRGEEELTYAVVDITNSANRIIEEVEESRTSFTLYEGAIFLHLGYPYLVKEFNSANKYAKVERVNVDWITKQRDFTDVDPIEIECIKVFKADSDKARGSVSVYFGRIQNTTIVFGYFKVNRRGEILEAVEVKNSPVISYSKGLWIDIPQTALATIKTKKLSVSGGIHAAQHAIINVIPLYISGSSITTDPNSNSASVSGTMDISTECKAPEKEFASRQTKRQRPPRLVFFDHKGGPSGTGVSFKAFERFYDILSAAFKLLMECECIYGCPCCIASGFCKEMMLVMSKPAAIIILASLLTLDLNEVSKKVCDGPEPNMPDIVVDTITSTPTQVKHSNDIEIINESVMYVP